jgi:hypothetical protein
MTQKGTPKPKREQAVREQLTRVQQLIAARGQDAASLVRTWMSKEQDKRKH